MIVPGCGEVKQELQWGRGSVAAETEPGERRFTLDDGTLQWGRGSVAAETKITDITPSNYVELQWGRGSVAAETCVVPTCMVLTCSFNGAAARWPRRHSIWSTIYGMYSVLQ